MKPDRTSRRRLQCHTFNAAQGAAEELPDHTCPDDDGSFWAEERFADSGPTATRRRTAISSHSWPQTVRPAAVPASALLILCRQIPETSGPSKSPNEAALSDHRRLRCTFAAWRFEAGRKYLLKSLNISRYGLSHLDAKHELALITSRGDSSDKNLTSKIISAQWKFVKQRLAFAPVGRLYRKGPPPSVPSLYKINGSIVGNLAYSMIGLFGSLQCSHPVINWTS